MSKLIGRKVEVFLTEDAAKRGDEAKSLGLREVLDVHAVNYNEHGGAGEGFVMVIYEDDDHVLREVWVSKCRLFTPIPVQVTEQANSKKK